MNNAPAGAKELTELVASPMADTHPVSYLLNLLKLSENEEFDPTVRLEAAEMYHRLKYKADRKLVWLTEVRGVPSRACKLSFISHGVNESEAQKKIMADTTYQALVKVSREVVLKSTFLGLVNPGTDWQDRYILI